jgi:tRNA pseudouridine38-40 synthase
MQPVEHLRKCLSIACRFGNFFNHVDNFPDEAFLFVTSGGIEATKVKKDKQDRSIIKDALVAGDASDSEEDELGFGNSEDGEG